VSTRFSSFGDVIHEIKTKLIPLANEAWRVRNYVRDAPDWGMADFDLDGAIREADAIASDLRKIRERKDQYRADLDAPELRRIA
jgi:hypothetical protein